MTTTSQHFRLRHVVSEDVARVHAFHKEHLTEFLFPRTEEEFGGLADDQALFEAVDAAGDTVAICYVRPVKNAKRTLEFGGVFVAESCRRCRLADALGLVAITSLLLAFGVDANTTLIAHVHEFNEKPRNLLKRLGFLQTGQETIPEAERPPDIKLNDDGELVGHVFTFDFASCAGHAQWLEDFDGSLGSSLPGAAIEVPFFATRLDEALEALRGIANGERHEAVNV